jgi:hypothetical protein
MIEYDVLLVTGVAEASKYLRLKLNQRAALHTRRVLAL